MRYGCADRGGTKWWLTRQRTSTRHGRRGTTAHGLQQCWVKGRHRPLVPALALVPTVLATSAHHNLRWVSHTRASEGSSFPPPIGIAAVALSRGPISHRAYI